MKQITENIDAFKEGTIFSIQDFCNIASYNTAKKSLQRIENSNKIRRIIDGIYAVPSHSKLTGEEFLPAPEDVAKYIAKRNQWSIAPSGNKCLNILGLSTQLPMEYVYICDGPSRKYDYLGTVITFKHVPQNEIKNVSLKNSVIIQALKILGKNYITQEVINRIRNTLTVEEQEQLLKECVNLTYWIRCYIEKICEGNICTNS